jgi:glycosyltransferase involved in cell wall biosynthesis
VEAGRSGWLVPAGAVEPLVAALREALAAPVEKLEAMGEAGRGRVRDRHSTSSQVELLLQRWQAGAGRARG